MVKISYWEIHKEIEEIRPVIFCGRFFHRFVLMNTLFQVFVSLKI